MIAHAAKGIKQTLSMLLASPAVNSSNNFWHSLEVNMGQWPLLFSRLDPFMLLEGANV